MENGLYHRFCPFLLQVTLLFPDEGLVYDYRLDDAGISLPAMEEDEEEEIKKRKVRRLREGQIKFYSTVECSGSRG